MFDRGCQRQESLREQHLYIIIIYMHSYILYSGKFLRGNIVVIFVVRIKPRMFCPLTFNFIVELRWHRGVNQ